MRWPGSPWGHRRWRGRLAACADGELSPPEERRFAAHVAACRECSEALDGLVAVKRLLAATATPVPAPRSFAITTAMLGAPSRSPQVRMPMLVMRVAQVAAGVAVLGLASLLVADFGAGSESGDGSNLTTAPMAADDEAAAGGARTREFATAANDTAGGSGAGTAASPIPRYSPSNVEGQGVGSPPPQPTPEMSAGKSAAAGGGTPVAAGDLADSPGHVAHDADLNAAEPGRDWLRAGQIALAAAAAAAFATYFVARNRIRR